MKRLGTVKVMKFRASKMRVELWRVFSARTFLFTMFQTFHVWLPSDPRLPTLEFIFVLRNMSY